MSFKITQFQTISRHQARISQSPTTIACLSKILLYIRTVLDDDQTTTLFQMIEHHLNTLNNTAHYTNVELLHRTILETISSVFYLGGLYDGSVDEFVPWLLSIPEIYDEFPVNYDHFSKALTLRLALEVFRNNHDKLLVAHNNYLATYLDKLMLVTKAPAYSVIPENSPNSPYAIFGEDVYLKLITLLNDRLSSSPPTDRIIDFSTYPDTITLQNSPPSDEDLALATVFLQDIYYDTTGTYILQFNLAVIYAIIAVGSDNVMDYLNTMVDCGELDGEYIPHKHLDYYHDHLDFVISSSMTPEYQAILTALRSNVNKSYSKVYYIQTLFHKHNFTLDVEGSIYKQILDKTLDLVNLTGLRRSILAISLIPYDNAGITYNKIVLSADNYNPDKTVVLADSILHPVSFRIAISCTNTSMDAYISIGSNQYHTVIDLTGIADIDPYFLFVIPKCKYPVPNTIRVQKVQVFGTALDSEHTESIVAGFRQQS